MDTEKPEENIDSPEQEQSQENAASEPQSSQETTPEQAPASEQVSVEPVEPSPEVENQLQEASEDDAVSQEPPVQANPLEPEQSPEASEADTAIQEAPVQTESIEQEQEAVSNDSESEEQAEVAKPQEAAEPAQPEVALAADSGASASEQEQEQEQEQEGEESEEEGGRKLPQLSEAQAALPWYVVHTYSGFESRVKLGLEERIRAEGLNEKFGHIIVPEESVVELVRGEKKTSKKKFFPGYILVQCDLDEDSWHLVKDTPKVTGFVGDSVDPVPLSKEEVDNLMQQMEGGGSRPRASVDFESGDAVKVVDGPFADFNGTVDDVKPDKGKLRVLISIFGRNTPVELDFVQVEKV